MEEFNYSKYKGKVITPEQCKTNYKYAVSCFKEKRCEELLSELKIGLEQHGTFETFSPLIIDTESVVSIKDQLDVLKDICDNIVNLYKGEGWNAEYGTLSDDDNDITVFVVHVYQNAEPEMTMEKIYKVIKFARLSDSIVLGRL